MCIILYLYGYMCICVCICNILGGIYVWIYVHMYMYVFATSCMRCQQHIRTTNIHIIYKYTGTYSQMTLCVRVIFH